jgi:hypothetical protein
MTEREKNTLVAQNLEEYDIWLMKSKQNEAYLAKFVTKMTPK